MKQVTSKFDPKMQHMGEMIKNLEERIMFLSETRNDAELSFEDFKSNNSLKLKVILDSNQTTV